MIGNIHAGIPINEKCSNIQHFDGLYCYVCKNTTVTTMLYFSTVLNISTPVYNNRISNGCAYVVGAFVDHHLNTIGLYPLD